MSEQTIEWTEEQREVLNYLRRYKRDSSLEEWSQHGRERSNEFRRILEEADFNNKDLSSSQLNQLFEIMRTVVRNRALSRALHKTNGIGTFNRALRHLLDEGKPLADRIDEFLKLKGVGDFTVSHFLFIFNPMKYPILSTTLERVLEIEARQMQAAEEQATKKYRINVSDLSYELTSDILSEFVIYDSLKDELGVENFVFLNGIFWKEAKRDEAEEEEPPFVTVSLEKDLRRYLAENPNMIEDGMDLVEEELNTQEVGIIDLLCKDENGQFVVVETKKGRSSDAVVGQILRYIGWVHNNRSEDVRGIIIVSDPDVRLDSALVTLPHVGIKYYRVRFEISERPF